MKVQQLTIHIEMRVILARNEWSGSGPTLMLRWVVSRSSSYTSEHVLRPITTTRAMKLAICQKTYRPGSSQAGKAVVCAWA